MEIIIGMILAFIAGAYIRKPFERKQKEEAAEITAAEEKPEKKAKQLNNLLSYTGKAQNDEDQ